MRWPMLAAFGLLCLTAVAGCKSKSPVPADWKAVPVGKGEVTVSAPKDYVPGSEPDDTTMLTPPGDPGIVLRLNFHQMDKPGVPKDIALRFVRDQAKEKGLTVSEKGDKAFFTESGRLDEGGKKLVTQFWQIGFGKSLIVLSATILEEQSDSDAVKECLEKVVPLMIESLKKK